MSVILASQVISGPEILWIVFVVYGIPALLILGVVVLLIRMLKK